MARTYNVVDADGHILEPLDLWDQYLSLIHISEPTRRS